MFIHFKQKKSMPIGILLDYLILIKLLIYFKLPKRLDN